jgi:hypothetical protein
MTDPGAKVTAIATSAAARAIREMGWTRAARMKASWRGVRRWRSEANTRSKRSPPCAEHFLEATLERSPCRAGADPR